MFTEAVIDRFGQQRGGGFGNRAAGTEETDVLHPVPIHFQKERNIIAAQRVVALRGPVGFVELAEIAGALAMVQNDLLIQVGKVVKHGRFGVYEDGGSARAAAK